MGHVIGIDTTYTGNPVSFNAVNGGTMKSVSVPLSPTQDLHGYANPWPAGGGVNKFYCANNATATAHGVTCSFDASTQTFTVGGTNDSSSAYILLNVTPTEEIVRNTPISRGFIGAPSGIYVNFVYYDGTWHGANNGDIIPDTVELSNIRVQVGVLGSATSIPSTTFKFQIQEGSTAPTSWTPYSNICPISGLTGLSVYVSPTQDPDDATVYNVDWSTQAGTVYGGTVDVVTGLLTVDRVKKSASEATNWKNHTALSDGSGYYIYSAGFFPANGTKISNSHKQSFTGTWKNLTFGEFIGTTSAVVTVPPEANTLALAKTYLESIGTYFVYPLATPLTYQLTPESVSALIGQNYIWSSNSETLTAVLTAPATGFAGWLIKCVTNGTPVEIPLKYMRAETYTVTPDQRMEWSAERDVTGVLHRETVQNLPPKIEFNTPLMTNSDINALNSIIKAAFTNYLQRNITIQFYDPERNQYWEWDCYMPDVKYHIRNADTVNNIINYEELRYAFIGY